MTPFIAEAGATPLPPFLGINFSPLTRRAIVAQVLAGTGPDAPCRLVVTANMDHVVRLSVDQAFHDAYDAAWIATADGAPVAWACRLAGVPVPGRVTGADLFSDVMRGLDPARHRPVFVVANRAVAEPLAGRLRAMGMGKDGYRIEVPPMGFERDPEAGARIVAAVRAIATTHLFMGIGAPRSEIFVAANRDRLRGVTAMCVGAGIAYHLGVKRRAPALLQRLGLEWSWRLLSEPRRLARRYLVDSQAFAGILARELLRRRSAAQELALAPPSSPA
jgi:N-acetylglucosaminyldiphosphoundecaprenol N-acetyl-beta-D-mannosaminyltransferase